MAKVRTALHLQAALDSEIGWRVSEISNLRSAIVNSEGLRRIVLLRAAVPIAYSHWEGFIKRSATYYATYLSSIGLFYKDLKPCFVGVGVMSLVQSIEGIKRKVSTASTLVAEIQGFGDKRVNIDLRSAVEDIGNLNFDAFKEIAEFLNVTTAPYETKRNFIDESLVAMRNKIAHGERLEVGIEGVQTAFDEVVLLLRAFKTDIENGATSKTFLA